MWDWNHFKAEGWLSHSRRALKLSMLMIAAALALLIHMVVPFWQQPKALRLCTVSQVICHEMSICKEISLRE